MNKELDEIFEEIWQELFEGGEANGTGKEF